MPTMTTYGYGPADDEVEESEAEDLTDQDYGA